ncbi:MAG: carboxy terminal-processing peptidase, partial [Flammeovirgaceae bacterium]|nr:carboxy terminal-processing peptidase [Flammeovirgaceae bacterium]
ITQAYDPHTDYFSPRDAQRFKEDLSVSLEGIGARLQSDNDYIKINEVLPGGPAEKSGKIHVNDRIIGVAQGDEAMVDIVGWRVDDAVKIIKGPKGTKVRLQILPAETGINGPSVEIVLIREKIKLEDLSAKKNIITYERGGKPMKLGVITLPSFYLEWEEMQKGNPNYNSTTKDVKKLIAELQAEGIDGLMLDLRNNGGGSLAEAIDLTGLFIKNGPVVQVKNSVNRVEVGADEDNSIVYNGPMVVLINRFSASASEIFAGAIQDYKRGIIVGESSYGKGTVQQVYPLSRFIQDSKDKTGELKLTLQKFYRVTGSSTQHKGVLPDVKLPSAFDPEQFGESSNPSALPWDEITGTFYNKTSSVNDKTLTAVARSYNDRMKSDLTLQRFADEINEARKNISQKRISLNEVTRKREMEEAEKKKAANDKLGTKITGKENKPVPLLELDDEYLRESLIVLGDLITSKIG